MIFPHERRRTIAEFGTTLWKDPSSVRFLGRWIRSLRPGHGPLEDRLPWMNFKTIRWLNSYLRPSMAAFEYGAGGSTPFVAGRVRTLISVESDREWYDHVSLVLRRDRITNCDLRFVPSVRRQDLDGAPYGPTNYTCWTPDTRGFSFEAYVRVIDASPDRSFDLVVVDGHARPSSVAHAIPKVRRGGYLLLDDSDQWYAQDALRRLDGFPRRDFRGAAPFQRYLQQASIWRL